MAGVALLASGHASAQTNSPIIQQLIPFNYDQNRNVGVLEAPRPDFDPLGIRIGGFVATPQLETSAVYTDNAYLSPVNTRSDAYFIVAPSVAINSDWSRHQLTLTARGAFRRYASEATLNRNEWEVRSLGRLDIGASSRATIEAQVAELREEPFSSQLDTPLALLSTYRRTLVSVRGERQVGRTRFIASLNAIDLDFSPIRTPDNTRISQVDRDRKLYAAAVQGEYALSPGAALLAQGSYTRTNYDLDRLLTGQPNRDSNSWRVIAGMNLDLPGFVRGTFGIGYSHRDFDSTYYAPIGGLSFQADLTYFMTQSTNFKLSGRRVIEDSAIVDSNAFFDTGVVVGVEQEFRRNLLGTLNASFARQDYVSSSLAFDIYQVDGGLQYLLRRGMRVGLAGSYSKRDRLESNTRAINEARASVTLTFQE